jgi:hypothetical protein
MRLPCCTYRDIFNLGLKPNGYVLLILQDKKLFKTYDIHQTEDHEQEKNLVEKFVAELGLLEFRLKASEHKHALARRSLVSDMHKKVSASKANTL